MNGPRVADSIVATDQLEVELLARNDSLRRAAVRLAELAMNWEGGDDSEYRNARSAFIELAHTEVETAE